MVKGDVIIFKLNQLKSKLHRIKVKTKFIFLYFKLMRQYSI